MKLSPLLDEEDQSLGNKGYKLQTERNIFNDQDSSENEMP